MKTQQSL